MDELVIAVICITILAALMRSSFGFGDGIINMPLLSIAIGLRLASPLVALVAFVIASTLLIFNWRNVHFNVLGKFLIPSLIGIPIGVWMLQHLNENIMKTGLASVIILFSLYSIFKPNLFTFKNDRWSYLFAFIAGILGGAYNINGLVIAIYGSLRKWEPKNFQATLQGYTLPVNIFIIFNHKISGLWNTEVFKYLLWALPFVLITVIFGNKLNKAIPRHLFSKYVYLIMLGVGILLLINTLY